MNQSLSTDALPRFAASSMVPAHFHEKCAKEKT
jgi:hypothetical protein